MRCPLRVGAEIGLQSGTTVKPEWCGATRTAVALGRSGAVFGQQIQSWAVDLTHLAAPSGRTSRIFLATLLPEQWERPTLCDCWRMRDVVAHLISYDELDIPGLLRRLAVGRLSLNRANAAGVAEYATASSEELLVAGLRWSMGLSITKTSDARSASTRVGDAAVGQVRR